MAKRLTQRRIALTAGAAALVVTGAAAVSWERLWEGYLAWRFAEIAVIAGHGDGGAIGRGPTALNRVRALDHQGRELWSWVGEPAPRNELVVYPGRCTLDPRRSRVYVHDPPADRIVALDARGVEILALHPVALGILAIEPVSGEIWCLQPMFPDLVTAVFDADGRRLATHVFGGNDIAHNSFDGSFWLVGKEILKVDRSGRELVRLPRPQHVDLCSVAADDRDGSVWIAASWVNKGRGGDLLHIDARGQRIAKIQHEGLHAFHMASDGRTGRLWVLCGDGILAVLDRSERLLEPPVELSHPMFGPRSEKLWVRTATAVAALDDQGRIAAQVAVDQPFEWFAVP